ncbi:MAG: C1 family peptidase [Deferribacteres bacterium]|nr:C1 family peptidase [Deferribacteres bacterium]
MSQNLPTRPDSTDFRDIMYQPALIQLPRFLVPKKENIRIRHQGTGSACTGFALAAIIDYLNLSQGIDVPASSRMLYEMAKRHDQWPGENYDGSSARGAMKGWQKNGVCPETDWPFVSNNPGYLTTERQQAALQFPLGAYYRVERRRSDLHTAINEAGAVFVTASIHDGWDMRNMKDGRINDAYAANAPGGHAFVLLGYTDEGFIVQNSWGEIWSTLEVDGIELPGCALWSYYDAERNMWDAWVARMGLSLIQRGNARQGMPNSVQPAQASAPPQYFIRDHYIHIDDGKYDPFGDYPSDEHQVDNIIIKSTSGEGVNTNRHILFYVHGGANNVKATAKTVNRWREVFAQNGVHEIHLMWESGLFEELTDILLGKEQQASQRAAGISDWTDRLIERLVQPLGYALWAEMQNDAKRAFRRGGAGVDVVAKLISRLLEMNPDERPRIHLVGHSAGGVWLAYLLQKWFALHGPTIDNLILFVPACTAKLYNKQIYPTIQSGGVKGLHHFQLDDAREQGDNVALIYRKSILYLVSRALQKWRGIEPIMGMEIYKDELNGVGSDDRIQTYNPELHRDATRAEDHSGFPQDATTMNKMLELILGKYPEYPFQQNKLGDN